MKLDRFNRTTLSALAAVALLTGCHSSKEAPPEETLPVATVRVQSVESKTRLATEDVVGTVRAKLRATIEAKISGRISQMPVVAGQLVKAGDLLVKLDAREIQAKLDQAKAVLEQAERDWKRFQKLLQEKAVTQQEFDAVDSRYQVASASVAEAESIMGYAQVEAPFTGVVTRKIADVGDLASPGRPLLELEDPQSLQLETDISEALVGNVKMDGRMSVSTRTPPTLLEGVVSEIAPASDPNSRTFRVKLDLPKDSGLRLGQFARVAVPVTEIASIRVPASAVVARGQMEILFVVTNKAVQLRLVKTGKQLADEIEILSGLLPGEQIAVEGVAGLRDGQPIVIQ